MPPHEFDIADSSHHSFSPLDVKHFGTCVICGKTDSQILHITTLQKDDTHHWYECPCGVIGWFAVGEKIEHSFDGDTDTTCDDCGYERTVNEDVPTIQFTVNGEPATAANAFIRTGTPFYGDILGDRITISQQLTAELLEETDTSPYSFSFSRDPGKPLPVGTHTVQILYNGTLKGITYENVVVCEFEITVHRKPTTVTPPTDVKLDFIPATVEEVIEKLPTTVTTDGDGTFAIKWSCDSLNTKPNGTSTFTWTITDEKFSNYAADKTSGTITVTNAGDGIITLTPADLANGPASGEGWSFNGTLTIESGYTLNFEGTCVVSVENYGTIESGTFSGGVENHGTITDGIFNGDNTVLSHGTIENGIFNTFVHNRGTIEDGTFNNQVENYKGTIRWGSFYASVKNTAIGATIAGGSFHGDVTNYQTITGGTFSGKLTNNQGSISGITIELSNALIRGDGSYGWSLDEDNNLILNSGISFYWKAGETCEYRVMNNGTIEGGTFSGLVDNDSTITGGTFSEYVTNDGNIENGSFDCAVDNKGSGTISGGNFNLISSVDNEGTIEGGNFSGFVGNDDNATIYGGVFTGSMGNASTVTGAVDLSTLNSLSDRGGKYGKNVKLPKAEIRGMVIYNGCDPSTPIRLEYYADSVKTDTWTVSGEEYSSSVEGWKRTDPDADFSTIVEIAHKVEAASMDGYEITVSRINNTLFHVKVQHTHNYGTEWKSDGTNHWHECSCGVKAEEAAHSGGTSTCTEKAICTACGQPYGATLGHDWGNWISNGDGTHTRTCANDANHTETNDCSGGTATCTEKAKCTACGTEYGNLAEHTYGTEWKSDGTNHWHECTCGAKAEEAAHSGGTATCTKKAKCTACGTEYGNLAEHTYGTEWKSDGTNHWHECSCGAKKDVTAHSGGTATCTEKAICTTCGQPYGATLGHDWGNWISNGDGTHTRTCANDANHTETDDCSGGTATCTEKAKCDVCDTAYGNLAEHTYGTEWKSDGTNHWHECACGAKSGEAAHSGGTATCTKKAECSICDEEYGDLAEHSYSTEWKSDGTHHWHECSCGAKADEKAHSGGTATCEDKAVCSACAAAYGQTNPTNHAGGTEVKNAKDATCGEGGYTGDTYCLGCGELLTKGTATEATGEHTYGNWKVVKAATTTAKGKEERTCSVCGHVESRDIPKVTDNPKTGDENNLLLWGAVMCVSVLGIVVLLAENKRRRSAK